MVHISPTLLFSQYIKKDLQFQYNKNAPNKLNTVGLSVILRLIYINNANIPQTQWSFVVSKYYSLFPSSANNIWNKLIKLRYKLNANCTPYLSSPPHSL